MDVKRILEIFENSPNFPNPPMHYLTLAKMSLQEKQAKNKLSEVLPLISSEKDILFRLGNSPYFGFAKKIQNVQQLVSNVGLETIRNLLFSHWLVNLNPVGSHDRLNYPQFHRTSLLTAFLAQQLSKYLLIGDPVSLYFQGLLQDFSLLALSRCIPELFHRTVDLSPLQETLERRENERLPATHPRLTVEIFHMWGISEEKVAPIRYHHQVTGNFNIPSAQVKPARILWTASTIAHFLLNPEQEVKTLQIENWFSRFFKQNNFEFHNFVRRSLQLFAPLAREFGLKDMQELSSIPFLIRHPSLFASRVVPYEELAAEVVKAYEHVAKVHQEVENLKSKLSHSQFLDPVTGLYNHAYFQEYLGKEIQKSARYDYPISLILMDVDDFGLLNSTHGFPAGNAVLQQLTGLLTENSREADVLARFGPDEFGMLLPHTGKPQARFVAEKLRKLVEQATFSHPHADQQFQITVSVGFATLIPSLSIMKKERLLDLAKAALIQAKYAGGNRAETV